MMPKQLFVLTIVTFLFYNAAEARPPQNVIDKIDSIFHNSMAVGNRQQFPQLEKSILAQLDNNTNLTKKQLAKAYLLAGAIKRERFKPDEALPFLINALKLCESEFGKTSPETIECKKYLSWSYGDIGNIVEEHKFNYELLDYYKSDEKKYVIELADMYNTIGQSYGLRGDRPDEQMMLNHAKDLLLNYQPENKIKEQNRLLDLINVYNSLAVSYQKSSNFYNALLYARKSMALRQILTPGSQEIAINWMTIGTSLYKTEGDYDSAFYYLNKSIELFERKNKQGESMKGLPPWAAYKSYIADILISTGRLDEAIALTRSTIEYILKNHLLDPLISTSLLQSYIALSKALIEKGEFKKSLEVCEEAMVKLEKNAAANNLIDVAFEAQYATALNKMEQWDKAGNAFKSAIAATGIDINQLQAASYKIPITVPYEYLNVYRQGATILIEKGFATHNKIEVESGIRMLRKIATSWANRKAWYYEAGIDEGIGDQNVGIYEDLLNAFFRAKGIVPEPTRMAGAFAAIEESKASLLKNKINEDKQMLLLLPDSVNRKRLMIKTDLYAALNNARRHNDEASQDSLLKKKEAYMAYLHEIRKKYFPEAEKELATIQVNDAILKNHKGVIINYFLSSQYLFEFIIENGKQSFLRKDIPVSFEKDLALLKQKCLTKNIWSDPATVKEAGKISKAWYQWLLGDVSAEGELVIIPHKELFLISFEMLDVNTKQEDANYVIQNRPVRYELSASLMQIARDKSNVVEGRMAFGGFASSSFDLNNKSITSSEVSAELIRGGIDQTLEGTNKEVTQISRLMNGDAFLHVHPEDFLRNADKYSILHVATHALADQGVYHESNLLFETDNAGKNIVRDVEISSLKLNADMAVLSACNTGLGKMHNSEGLLNLGRSFFIAGCPSVVMSLWTVNDASTARIMTDFYQYLKKGESKSAALQHAKLDYLKTETNPAKRHPYYWAGFIVVGDNSPLKNIGYVYHTKDLILPLLLLVIIAGAGVIYFLKRSKSSVA